MGSTEDNSPLWGSGQFSYPDFSRPSAVSAWPDTSNPPSTQLSFDPYGATSRDTVDYTELKPDSFLHHQQAPPVPHGGFLPSLIQHPPFLNGHNVLLPESTPYLSPMLAIQNQHMSPDGGYSSPGSAGSEYYGLPYHGQPQDYMAAMSPYNHQIPSVGSEPTAVEQPIKQETQEVQQTQPPVYAQQLEYIVQNVDDSKPIIHENIMLCPPLSSQPQPQQQIQPVVESQQFHISAPVHQSVQQTTQATVEITQAEIDRLIYRTRYVVPAQEHQLSPSREPVALYPAAPLNQVQVTGNIPLDSDEEDEEKEIQEPAPMSPEADSPDPEQRRSARPSVIEHSEFECDKCGHFFARKCGLTQHQKWIHTERLLPCEKCGKKFVTQDDLDKHIIKHTQKDKPHKCSVCPKQFCHKNDLRRHMFRHTDKVPYSCGTCHRGFIRQDHLIAHEISHARRRKMTTKKPAEEARRKEENARQQQHKKME